MRLLVICGLFLLTTVLVAVFAVRVNPRRRPWDAVIGSVYATAAVFALYFVLDALTNWQVAAGVVTVVSVWTLYRVGEFGGRRRLVRLRRTAVNSLAALPVVPVEILHPRRESGRCTCRAQRFFEALSAARPATVSVSTVALTVWRGDEIRQHIPLGEIQGARLVRTVYRFLSPFRGDATDMDGLRLPAGWTYRVRFIMADRSDVFVSVRSRHHARLFLELFNQVHRDGELRILAVLENQEQGRQDVADLRQRTGMPAAILAKHLEALAEQGLVDRSRDDVKITESGLFLLWERTDAVAKVVTPTNDLPI